MSSVFTAIETSTVSGETSFSVEYEVDKKPLWQFCVSGAAFVANGAIINADNTIPKTILFFIIILLYFKLDIFLSSSLLSDD